MNDLKNDPEKETHRDGFAAYGWRVNALTSNTIVFRIYPGSIGQLLDAIILAQQVDQALLAAHMQCAYDN